MSSRVPPSDLPLNKSQRRHLTATLDKVDRAFADIAALPELHSAVRLLRQVNMDVDAEALPQLVSVATRARSLLARGAESLQLPADVESVHRKLSAQLSTALVLLYDAGSRGMRAYGAVDPVIEKELDPWLEELRGEVRELMALLQRR